MPTATDRTDARRDAPDLQPATDDDLADALSGAVVRRPWAALASALVLGIIVGRMLR